MKSIQSVNESKQYDTLSLWDKQCIVFYVNHSLSIVYRMINGYNKRDWSDLNGEKYDRICYKDISFRKYDFNGRN